MHIVLRRAAAVLALCGITVFSGCGGGGGGDSSPPPPAPAAGDVATNGAFAGAGSSGCRFSATLAPRPSGKAVHNIAIRFNGGVCALGTEAIAGIAAAGGAGAWAVLYTAAINPTRSAGFVPVSTR